MRIDDIAYQRATKVATLGFLAQLLIGLGVLVFGIVRADTALVHAACYILPGTLAWLALGIIFNQHRMEQIESKEADELQRQRLAGLGSAFDESEEFNVAARRLRIMYKWLMPLVSFTLIFVLGGLAAFRLYFLYTIGGLGGDTGFFQIVTEADRGWALALCLVVATASFIFSRYVSGMSKQPAWQNLRGGAGYMVGNSVVLLAVAAGIIFTYFDNDVVMEWIAYAIPWFMIVYAAETFLNFLLNLYRPRRAGEVPRPAFDSRLLSLLSAPDSIVRSINEAVNYQFGFDITSSWGYQLLLRAGRRLAVLAAIILVLLNCMVVVEPHQQGVILQGGSIVRIEGAGPMFKWPWPIQQAEVYDVTRVRGLPLTIHVPEGDVTVPLVWSSKIDVTLGVEPFIVSATLDLSGSDGQGVGEPSIEDSATSEQIRALQSVNTRFALIESEFVLHYRIKEDPAEGLEKFLRFSNETRSRRQRFNMRQRSLKSIALREITQYLSEQDLDRIISQDRSGMVIELVERIQTSFDHQQTGVEVLAVTNPWIRPAGDAASKFEVLAFNQSAQEQTIAKANRGYSQALTVAAGSPERAEALLAAIHERGRVRDNGADAAELAEHDAIIEQLLAQAGGRAAEVVSQARADLWLTVLNAEARLERFEGRRAAYAAAPDLYREYLMMDVLTYILEDARKYFIGVDPEILALDIKILEDDKSLVFDEAIPAGQTVEEGVGGS